MEENKQRNWKIQGVPMVPFLVMAVVILAAMYTENSSAKGMRRKNP